MTLTVWGAHIGYFVLWIPVWVCLMFSHIKVFWYFGWRPQRKSATLITLCPGHTITTRILDCLGKAVYLKFFYNGVPFFFFSFLYYTLWKKVTISSTHLKSGYVPHIWGRSDNNHLLISYAYVSSPFAYLLN
jgi:hypothetical protein